MDDKCIECDGNLIVDDKTSDLVCISCGLVATERIATTDLFHNTSYIKVGLSDREVDRKYSKFESGEFKRFLEDGIVDINTVLNQLWGGEILNKGVLILAEELYRKIVKKQQEQKSGTLFWNRSDQRKHFSRRKQCIVACIYRALIENSIERWDICDISSLTPGSVTVTIQSVNKIYKEFLDG